MGIRVLIASISALVALASLLAGVDSAQYCAGELDPIIKQNVPECPPPLTFNATLSKCCGDQPIYAGQRPESGTGGRRRRRGRGRRRSGRRRYCGPYLLVNGEPDCPSTHPYDERRDKCCGRRPIDGYRDDRRRSRSDTGCVDKNVPGRPSDCPANKGKCDDPLWRDLMTDQCPKTCNRCGQTSNYRATSLTPTGTPGVGGVGIGVGVRPGGACVDGVGPNGVSECPQNAALCNHPSYSAFMRIQCPATCGVCGSTGTGISRTYPGRRRLGGRRGGRQGGRRRRRLRDSTGRRRRRRGGRRRSRDRRSRRRRRRY